MNKFFSTLSLLILIFLTACNGSSGENEGSDSSDNEAPVASSIVITLINEQGNIVQSFAADKVITIQVKVTSSSNEPIINKRVNVSTDLGQLSNPSKLTDAQGIAELTINNDELVLSAGTLTATVDELSESMEYEFIQHDDDIGTPTLALSMSVNGITTNQFKADELAQITMTLLDPEGMPIVNEIINLTADVGILEVNTNFNDTALTNSSGKATVSLAGIDESGIELLGAGAITATAAQDNSINNRLNYQIVSSNSVIVDDVRIGTLR